MKDYKFISKVGIEPTFGFRFSPKLVIKKDVWRQYHLKQNQFFIEFCRDKAKHPWIRKKAYRDGDCLEVPTSREYDSLLPLIRSYKSLLKELNEFGYAESSVAFRGGGGCHINVDLSFLKGFDRDFKQRFYKNMILFFNNSPSIVWANHSPINRQGAEVLITLYRWNSDVSDNTGKSCCINFRKVDTFIPFYVEMRFFAMQKTVEELAFDLIVADKLIKFIWWHTQKGAVYGELNTLETLQEYTIEKAESELRGVLKAIEVDISEAEGLGKFAKLKERFSYGQRMLL
jgi:hypothetical protein